MIILIPAYEPDQRLLTLVDRLCESRPRDHVLVVDDGSGTAYAALFAEARRLGAVVVSHAENRGKGRALKTGFAHAMALWPGEDVVCADSDGQHRPEDVYLVGARVALSRKAMVLGARQFTGAVPLRSRLGNEVTRRVFGVATGIDLRDTQTGLRGIPAPMLPWLIGVPGERFEWEQEVLLQSRSAGWALVEEPIETVYLEGNSSSHFRPVVDSFRVLTPIARFAGCSLGTALLDDVLFLAFHALTGSLLGSIIPARLVSASVNYLGNERLVFGRASRAATSPRRYAALALTLLAANWLLLHVLVVGLGWSALTAKLTTDVVLFFVSYAVQRRFVFVSARSRPGGRARPEPVEGAVDVVSGGPVATTSAPSTDGVRRFPLDRADRALGPAAVRTEAAGRRSARGGWPARPDR